MRAIWFLASLAFTACLIALWQLASATGVASPIFLPAPTRVWDALVAGFSSGAMPAKLGATTARVFAGWVLASLLGVALGALIGVSQRARIYIAPSLEFLRPLPVSALVPIFIGLLGYSEQMVLVVIAFGAFWPCLLSTIYGFSAVEPRLYEVSSVLGLSRWSMIRKIALPSALPDIVAGMRVGLTVSLILVVVAEILGSREGIGYDILLAQRAFKSADLFAGIILLGLIGYASAMAINWVESRLVHWR